MVKGSWTIEGPVDAAEMYCDGGLILENPSPWGGTWAWVAVSESDAFMASEHGYIEVSEVGACVSNNVAEFVAAVRALERTPEGWKGTLYSDSQVTLGRLKWGWTLRGLPVEWVKRGSEALAARPDFRVVLLQGHPTRAELAAGVGTKRGLPVSKWNAWCDAACSRLAARRAAERVVTA